MMLMLILMMIVLGYTMSCNTHIQPSDNDSYIMKVALYKSGLFI